MIRHLCLAVTIAVAAGGVSRAQELATPGAEIMQPDALETYFRAREAGQGVRVLHLGDSHIARDSFSGDLRQMMSGDMPGARGLLPPGLVYPFLQLRGVEIDASEGWTIYRARDEEASGPFGLMSAKAEAAAGSSPTLTLSGFEVPADRLLVGYLRQPDGGAVQVQFDGAVQAIPTQGDEGPAFAAFAVPEATQIIRIMPAGDGPVALLSMVLEADRPGVVLSNAGWPGATSAIMQRWDDEVLRLELQRLDPHLVILSYGTNEGFDDELDLDAYEANFRDQITRLKRFAPNASVLITGGPDGTRLPVYADTESRDPEEWTCAPLSGAERETYAALIEAESASMLRWHEPPMLKPVLSVQREVARDQGAAHWNWREAMGGACAVHDWRLADDPQLARPDHVHLTGEGYALSARMLMDALNGAFVAWQGDGKGQAVP
ncbi:GDSL-type esterase/lipase family protein [Pyruvatibacter mobilis]|uniref:GDSL-type esterase/lipase family protein n=1 Tax=Pyruvatibacter mobilis TaxID=1712261 RepID=UPI003D0DD1B9